tara:strand:+ start:52 stop:597 length:546 start_codon:yes stop_codon:yes gene_type:complete
MSNHTPKKPSQEVLDRLTANYTYDRDAGQVFNNKTGKPSLSVSSRGYLRVTIYVNSKTKFIQTHHAVWFFEYGEWPTSCMDHIDGIKTNNHYTNLRLVTNRENIQAYRKSIKSSSPYQGVTKDKRTGGFSSRIRFGEGSKQTYLGYFTCELEAARTYDKALVGLGLKPVNVEIMKGLQQDD